MSAGVLIESGALIKHIGISTLRVFGGFLITICLAIPLLILWFGIGEKSKIIIIVLASFFPVLLNTINGVQGCDKKLIEVGQIFNLNNIDVFKKIIIPWSLPNILVGMRLGVGYSWRAIIGAEMVAASSGLGYLILDGQQLSRSAVVIVGILSIGILGSLSDWVFSLLTNKFIYIQEVKSNEGV